MCQGNLRAEENTYLSLPPEVGKDYPDDVLETYGYKASGSGLGWVSYKEPLEAVLGRKVAVPSLDFSEVGITV